MHDENVQTKMSKYLLTSKKVNIGMVRPPLNITVEMVTTQVVVKNSCRTSVTVFLIARAKAIAPRRPANQSMCWYC